MTRNFLKVLAFFFVMAWFMVWGGVWYLDLPRVQRSLHTGECVNVDDPVTGYTCETVPVWPAVYVWVP